MKNIGVITTYFSVRKFGFLKSEGRDVFFHALNFKEGVPTLGQKVEFELGEPARLGMPKQAVNIQAVDDSPLALLSGSTTTSTEVARG